MIGLWPADAAPLLVGCEREETRTALALRGLPNGRAPLLAVLVAERLGALDAREDLPRGLGVVSAAVEAQDDLVGPERCLAMPRAAVEADPPTRNVQAMATVAALVEERLRLAGHRWGRPDAQTPQAHPVPARTMWLCCVTPARPPDETMLPAPFDVDRGRVE